MGVSRYAGGFELALHEDALGLPLKWKKPRMIFVDSMSDLFHDRIPFEFVDKVFDVIRRAPQHIYQILTKRSYLMKKYSESVGVFPDQVWAGVSIENAGYTFRIDHLRSVRTSVRFLSIEPLLGPVGKIDLSGIHWVIVGGESGPKFRSVNPDWVREIRDQCVREGVPLFFKQWGGRTAKSGGQLLDGRVWNQFPKGESVRKLRAMISMSLPSP
jgi:protein gp37